jgi:hypothetical protein
VPRVLIHSTCVLEMNLEWAGELARSYSSGLAVTKPVHLEQGLCWRTLLEESHFERRNPCSHELLCDKIPIVPELQDFVAEAELWCTVSEEDLLEGYSIG